MASGKSVYLAGRIQNAVLGGPTFALPATVYIALSTALWDSASTGASMSEVAGGSYARVAVTNDSTRWPNATPKANGTVITFPAATASWGNVKSFYIVDAASGGNVLYGGDLSTARDVNSGDTASFAIGAIQVTEA